MTQLWIPVSSKGQAATQDEACRRQLLNASRSFAYFSRYWHFRDPKTGRVLNLGQNLWPGQLEFIRAAQTAELKLTRCTRAHERERLFRRSEP